MRVDNNRVSCIYFCHVFSYEERREGKWVQMGYQEVIILKFMPLLAVCLEE